MLANESSKGTHSDTLVTDFIFHRLMATGSRVRWDISSISLKIRIGMYRVFIL